MKPTNEEFIYLGHCLEGFFFGLYSGIFAMYLQHSGSQKGIFFHALWVLYALSAAIIIIDILYFSTGTDLNIKTMRILLIIQGTACSCCDFIAQSILIYRCWLVWGRNIRVVILPLILAFAFLVIWIAACATPLLVVQDGMFIPAWNNTLVMTGLTLSMTVNALVTGLIVLRIFKVFCQVNTGTADDQFSGVIDGSTLRRIIFILIESGMALFSIQLVRLVVSIVPTDSAYNAYNLILGIHQMLNGFTPTMILVRVSMGLSFHDEKSMVEASVSSLRFALPNPIPETGISEIVNEERRDNDIETRLSDHSEI